MITVDPVPTNDIKFGLLRTTVMFEPETMSLTYLESSHTTEHNAIQLFPFEGNLAK